ncbi:MAG: RecX family transcriptional regulator [Bacteroidales bacterium]|nr:RecX family transcriptional regulator [Bacteroidales bacterium]
MNPTKTITIKVALTKAQNLCATQEKCISDISKKLFDWKLPSKDHDTVINLLLEDKFIDEQRYAVFYAKDKFKYNKWGKIKIEYTLKQKNISSENIKSALDKILETEYDKLLESELIKKFKTIKDSDEYTIKSKLVRFAISRGFENGKVFDIVSSIIEKLN